MHDSVVIAGGGGGKRCKEIKWRKKYNQGNLIYKKIEGCIFIVVLILIKLPTTGSLFGLFGQYIQRKNKIEEFYIRMRIKDCLSANNRSIDKPGRLTC